MKLEPVSDKIRPSIMERYLKTFSRPTPNRLQSEKGIAQIKSGREEHSLPAEERTAAGGWEDPQQKKQRRLRHLPLQRQKNSECE